jgi:translocation and assembly module TamA
MTLPPLRAAALLLALVLGGCAALKPAPEAPAASAAPPPVDVAIEAPDDLRRLLSTHLDIARLAREAAGETLAESELRRLELATPAEARALLATEGFMDAQVHLQREVDTDATPPRPRVRVIVTPGTRTRVVAAALKVNGALADAAARRP